MGTSAGAYGAFHHDVRNGKAAGSGVESDQDGGALAFWKGRHFVSVIAVGEGPGVPEAVAALGRRIAAALGRRCGRSARCSPWCSTRRRVRPGGSPPADPASGSVPASSTVVLVREAGVLDANGRVVPEVLASMLDRAVCELAGQADPVAAFRTFLKPTDTLGIKTNVWRFLATPPPLEQALRQRAIDCGIPAAKIAVDDRGVLENPVFRSATALINVRPMRTHHWSGVGSLLKNYIMFSPSPPDWHGDSCADLGGVWKLPACAGKTRLNVLVMLTPLYQSEGPHDFNAKYTWPYRGLIVSTDPVAADATGLRILEAKRRAAFGTDQPFEVPPKHIRVAAEKFGLGVADPARIRLKKLGWAEDALV